MSEYFKLLEETCDKIEKEYGLDTVTGKGKLSDLDIRELLSALSDNLSMSEENRLKDKISLSIFPYISILSHLILRTSFLRKTVLDFSQFLDFELSKIVAKFKYYEMLDEKIKMEITKITSRLDEIDKNDLKLRYSLEYRYVRMFVMMTLSSNYVEASIVSRLLIEGD